MSIHFAQPLKVAGVTLEVVGHPTSAIPYRLAVRTAQGEVVFARGNVGPGWVVGSQLCPIVPSRPPLLGTALVVNTADPVKSMTVWAVEEGEANTKDCPVD